MRSDEAVNSPQANKEMTFQGHMLVGAYASCPKIHFRIALQHQACSQFVLNFPPNVKLVFL